MSATTVVGWLLHTLLGGGVLLLLARAAAARTRSPARRQRLGEGAVAAALVLALLSLAPAWLSLTLPAEALPVPAAPPPAVAEEATPPAAPARAKAQAPALADATPEGVPWVVPVLAAPVPEEPAPGASPPRAEVEAAAAPPAPAASAAGGLPAWVRWAVAAYLCVAAALAGRWLLGHAVLWRLLRRAEPVPPEVARLFRDMTEGRWRPRLVVSRRVRVPFSCGLLRPTVVLPAALGGAAPAVLRWVLAHELTHLGRRDAWSGALFGLGQAVYFPLPWFWWLRRQVRLCQEYLADAAAAAIGCPEDYAQFLLGWTAAPAPPAGVTGVFGQCSDLYRRITMLLEAPTPPEPRCPRRWALPVAAGLLSLAVLGAGVEFGAHAAPVPKKYATDDGKKDQPKKEDGQKDAPKKEAPADPAQPGGVAPLDPDDFNPFNDPNVREKVREQLERHRKEMERVRQQLQQRAFPGANLGGYGVMPLSHSRQARLGARVEAPSPTLADQLDLPRGQGLVLKEVLPDSAAAKAGLKSHDVLLEINGKPVPDSTEGLSKLLADIKADTPVDAVVLRKGKKETIKGLKLPEARAAELAPLGLPPNFPNIPGFQGGINLGGPGGFGGGVFMPVFGGRGVMTTTFRDQDRFTTRHQEGSLVITLTGKVADGKAKVSDIHVQDGRESHKYPSADKVPEQYRDKVKNLVEMTEKSSVKIEIKEP